MGNEQSDRSNNKEERKLSEAEVKRLLDAQRKMYEKKVQECVNNVQSLQLDKAESLQQGNATGTASFEREPALYSYAREDLQNVTRNPTSPNLYPNLNANQPTYPGTSFSSPTVHTFDFRNYVSKPPPDYVFVNNNGQAERPRPSAPPHHSASPHHSGPLQHSTPPQFAGRQRPRDRSISKSRYLANDNELNCPTCKTMFGLQIFQCSSGHSSCKTCKDGRRPCGICGHDITSMRNIDVEKYVAERKVPCPNSGDGCMLLIKMADLEFHVKECPFKELQCPVGCFWKGKLKQLSAHFDAMHPQQRSADVGSEIRLQNISDCSQNLFLVLIGAYNFLFHVKVSKPDNKIYMGSQLIGTRISASKWSYEVHVYNKNECRRKYTHTDICSSFQEPIADIFKDGRCSVLPLAYASTFINNGELVFKFFIKKTIDDKPRGNFKNQRGRGRGRQ